MKIKCNTIVFNEAILTASKVAVSGAFSQATGGALLEATEKGIVKMTCNSLETSIEYTFSAEVLEKGVCVVPAKLLGDIVRHFTAEEVVFEVEGEWGEGISAHVSSGKSKFDISTLNPEDFPPVPVTETENAIIISADTFKDLVKGTAFAASITDTRAILTGCLVEVDKAKIRMVGLDGYRMGLRDAKTSGENAETASVVIPARALNEFCKIVGDFDGDIRVELGEKYASFIVGDMIYKTKKINGEYVDYKLTMPEPVGETTEFDVETSALLRAIERATLVIMNDQMRSPLKVHVDKSGIVFSCETVAGKSEEILSVEGIKGSGLDIGFNHRFILDAVKNIPTDRVHIRMETKSAPCVLTPMVSTPAAEKEENTGFVYTILPVRM